MKNRRTNLTLRIGTLTAALLSVGVASQAAEPTTLKDAYKDHFYVGVAINRTIALGAAVRADNVNRNMEQVTKDTALAIQQFNQIVPENDLKWALIHPNEGPDGYDFAPADAFVNFGLTNNMYLVGHTLVWHAQTPNWVFAGTNLPPGSANVAPAAPTPPVAASTGTNGPGRMGRRGGFGGPRGFSGPRASREELLQRMHDHINTVVTRYKGKIKVWDVVNEAISDGGTNILRSSPWHDIIGDDFIEKAFQYAHEADPNAILRYNDYSLEDSNKRKKLIALIKDLQSKNVPVMAIGSQTHISVSSPTYEQEDRALTEMETLGLPIHITELDINSASGGQRSNSGSTEGNAALTQGGLVSDSDKKLADAYERLFRVFLKHEKFVKVVTFWGINDGVSWRAQGKPLLFDSADQPKPAFYSVLNAPKGEQPKDK
jgi:endo-1,4-beta-xylanase